VQRSACPDDRRGILAELTDTGYETLRRTSSTHLRGVDEHFAARFTPAEAATLADLLGRLTAAEATDT
jgi:DNA-binding MarR family transcriptional regulator